MYQINDEVCALDDDFQGIIVSIKGDLFFVEDTDGFVMEFRESEIIPVINDAMKKRLSQVPENAILEKIIPKKSNVSKVKSKDRNLPTMEVDLHIHNLTDRYRGMSNHAMLNLQLDTARRQLDFAIQKRIQKMVFIHGVGEGVLKQELYTLFRRYDNIKYYDADFQKYGLGATEIHIYQNLTA